MFRFDGHLHDKVGKLGDFILHLSVLRTYARYQVNLSPLIDLTHFAFSQAYRWYWVPAH
jgi:hypothetical protein